MNKLLKKILYLAFAALLVAGVMFGSLTTQTYAATKVVKMGSVKKGKTFTLSKLDYKITKVEKNGGTVAITGNKSLAAKVVIPATVKVKSAGKTYTFKVTEIGAQAFQYNYSLKELTIGKNVTTIKANAFNYCYYMKSLKFAKGSKISTIDDTAFNGCYGVRDMVPKKCYKSVKKLIKKVKKYSYSVQPVRAPFNRYFYVKTNNPDGSSFGFEDIQTKKKEEYENNSITLCTSVFSDVKYVNASKYKVKGGYIFQADSFGAIDGGSLALTVYTPSFGYVDTGIRIDCAEVQDGSQYILDRFTNSKMTFEEKVNAISDGIKKYQTGYVTLFDDTKLNNSKIKYPYLVPGYWSSMEQKYLEIYKSSEMSLLATASSPFGGYGAYSILKGAIELAYPGSKVVSTGFYGSYRVTYGKKSTQANVSMEDTYILKKYVKVNYTFDGTVADMAENSSLSVCNSMIKKYATSSNNDIDAMKKNYPLKDFYSKMKTSSWIKVYDGKYIYLSTGREYYTANERKMYENAWIDGRYVDNNGCYVKGAKFSDHPTASVILTNQTYTNVVGDSKKGDLTYEYDSGTGKWISYDYNYLSSSVSVGTLQMTSIEDRPSRFILTRSDVLKLSVDKYTNTNPSHGYIFDGTVKPGTQF